MRQLRADSEAGAPAFSQSIAAFGYAKTKDRGLTILFGVCAVLFFILAIIGTVHNYSPVPFWDMWDDYIEFYLKIHAGDWSAWWAPHNEHRIILARLFFWIDIAYFHGNGIFSLLVIYVCAASVGLVFAKIWREQSQGRDLHILFFVEAWIFSWVQAENFTWAFQSQFILAQLLPLAGLYFLYLSSSKPNKTKLYFSAGTVCGVLAVGSMANGVLALPALALYTAIATRSFRRTAILATLSAAEMYLYFQHWYASQYVATGPSITGELLQHPIAFVEFCLIYLGNPFIALLGSQHAAIVIGEVSAAALVLGTALAFYVNLREAARRNLPLALLIFIFYIMATAAITAAGRLPMGVHEALASRYQTPALYGWAAALLLFWPSVAKSVQFKNDFFLFLAVFLFCFMVPRQFQALSGAGAMTYQRELAALALELQVDDVDNVKLLYAFPDTALNIAHAARDQHLSVFGFPPLRDAHLLVGQTIKTGSSDQCLGHIDSLTLIPDAPQYVRVTGWLYNPHRVTKRELVVLADRTNEIVGLGLLGEKRFDVEQALGRRAAYSGFQGYLSAKAYRQPISIFSPDNGCELPPMTAALN
jgi:hypothetical protein